LKNGTTASGAAHTFLEAVLAAWAHDAHLHKHRHLYEVVRSLILRGDARPGAKLPSTRECASALRIGRNTALRAYQQLLDEGYLEARTGDGTFVAAHPPDVTPRAKRARRGAAQSAQLSARASEILARAYERPAASTAHRDDAVRHAFLPASDLAAFPWKIWHRLVNRHLSTNDLSRFGPGSNGGDARLKAALSEHLQLARGVHCTSEQVLITHGAQQALLLIALALGNPGDVAWVEEPGHDGTRAAIVAAGMRAVPVRVDEDGIAWHAQLSAPRLIFVTPSHQFPLGAVLSLARRRALLDIAARSGAWIVEDDYDSEFRHTERPLPALQGLDTGARVIYLGTFGRVLFHRLRLAYLVLPPALVEPLRRLNTRLLREPAPAEQGALADFIEEGHFAAHIRKMRVLYRRRRDKLCAALQAAFGERVHMLGTDAGVHFTLRLPPHVDDKALCSELAKAGLDVLALSDFYLGKPEFPGLILGFSGVDDATLALATFRLCAVLEKTLDERPRRHRNALTGH
jgi:GntR family transcriptional regulator / MocR family aminotransferase